MPLFGEVSCSAPASEWPRKYTTRTEPPCAHMVNAGSSSARSPSRLRRLAFSTIRTARSTTQRVSDRGLPPGLLAHLRLVCCPISQADGYGVVISDFDKYPGVWCHGDYLSATPSGGFIVYGRSDATLNPGGVRIGTAVSSRHICPQKKVQPLRPFLLRRNRRSTGRSSSWTGL